MQEVKEGTGLQASMASHTLRTQNMMRLRVLPCACATVCGQGLAYVGDDTADYSV